MEDLADDRRHLRLVGASERSVRALLAQLEKGDSEPAESARRRLIEGNLRLVVSAARRYLAQARRAGASMDLIVDPGQVGDRPGR